MNDVALCLPKGENMVFVQDILSDIGFPIEGYSVDNRSYRPVISKEGVRAKIFAERDVVIQVATGNYSLGFCSLDWIEEFRTKFPKSGLRIYKRVGDVTKRLFACCHSSCKLSSIDDFNRKYDLIRIVSEYYNIAEDFAIKNLWKKSHVFSAWGAADVYPPEHAEIVVQAVKKEDHLYALELKPLVLLLESRLCIVVNQGHYESMDLSPVLNYFSKIKNLSDQN